MQPRFIALSLSFVVAMVAGAIARQASPAQLELQTARKLEVVDRDLKSAIVRYREVVAKYPNDRAVVPEALLGLAGCLEQLGQPEARGTYERLVKEYPGTAQAKAAQVRLDFGRQSSLLTKMQLGPDSGGAPSFGGGIASFIDRFTNDLMVRDLKSGRAWKLTRNEPNKPIGDDSPLTWDSAPSPDGKQIAYSSSAGSRLDFAIELRVVSSRGGSSRAVCCRERGQSVEQFSWMDLFGWSRDNQEILFSLVSRTREGWTTRLAAVPAAGGIVRVLGTINGLVGRAAWSPDGRFIVYDAPRSPSAAEHAVFIMDADGSNVRPLIAHSANDRVLDWFPDGKRILFVSDYIGADGVWDQAIADGKAVNGPRLIEANVGRIWGKGFTRDGAYYYEAQSTLDDVLTLRLNASGLAASDTERLPGRMAPGSHTFRRRLDWRRDLH